MSEIRESTNDSPTPWIIIIVIVCFFLLLLGGIISLILYPSEDSHLVETDQKLESGMPYLIYETNFPDKAQKCVANETYGITDEGEFYVKDGCSGIFLYRDNNNEDYIGTCTTSRLGTKRCTIGNMRPDISPIDTKRVADTTNPVHVVSSTDPLNTNMNGLIKKIDSNIVVMSQNGKCDPNNYGFHGNNMIYTENGCDGVFRIGTLIGECGSSSSSPGGKASKTLCPIGRKEEINGRQMGLVLTDLISLDKSDRCQTAPNAYGIIDINNGFRDPNACQGNMAFKSNLQDNLLYANYEVECDPYLSTCGLSSIVE